MATKTTKARKANVPVPGSIGEASEQLARIGALRRDIEARKHTADNQVAEITRHIDEALTEPKQELAALEEGLRAYCEENRAALTDNGRTKTVKLATGRVSWRNLPAKVSVRGAKDVIARIKALGLTDFLREKTEVNKEAMLEKPDQAAAIEGVTIGSGGEEFSIEPSEVAA